MNIEEARSKLISFIDFYNKKPKEENRKFKMLQVDNIDIKAIETLLTAYEKEKEKNKKIDEFCRKELAFERRLKRENREPDEFNQGRFYVSENIRKIIVEE